MATKPTEPACEAHQQYNENGDAMKINSGLAPSEKTLDRVQMQYRTAVHSLSPSGMQRNTQMLLLGRSGSEVSEENETSPVATDWSKISKRLKRSLNENYLEHSIVQRGCFRGQAFDTNQKASRPTQSTDQHA